MARANAVEDLIERVKTKVRNEWKVKLEYDLRQNELDGNPRTELEIAQEAYQYATEMFFRICGNRGLTILTYHDPELHKLMEPYWSKEAE